MKVETKENQIILKEVYNSITLETKAGKQLRICMRDKGFEMKIDDGEWHLLTDESDFLIKPNELTRHDVVGQSEQLVCCCDNPNEFREMENKAEKLNNQQDNGALPCVSVRDFIIGDVVCTKDGRMWVINEIDGDDLLVDGNGKRNYPLEKCDISHAH